MNAPAHKDVQIGGRRYRVTYYSNGEVSDVLVCDVRTRERGQPHGAWALDGVRRLPKTGQKAKAVLAAVATQKTKEGSMSTRKVQFEESRS